jgi:hypothetical protein
MSSADVVRAFGNSATLHTPSIAPFTLSDLIKPLFVRFCINPPLLFPELLQAMLCPVAKLALLCAECLMIARRHTLKAEKVISEYRSNSFRFFRALIISHFYFSRVWRFRGFGGVRVAKPYIYV